MKAIYEKFEIAAVSAILIIGGVAGCAWLFKVMHGSLLACAAFTPATPII